MGQNKEQLNKLLDFIGELSKDEDNAWFVDELRQRYGVINGEKIEDIYEYCIERILVEQATQFYKDFPIKELSSQLITDYCRMERYKRHDNFSDFCLAVFQQVENITNWFCKRDKFIDLYKSKQDKDSCFKDKDGKTVTTIGNLIILSDYYKRKNLDLKDLFFNERIRAVLYFVFFGEKTTIRLYEAKYNELNELYQCRNLNHRGGERNKYQEDIISNILPHQYLYYLKFTGLLVGFVEQISKYMAKDEVIGCITNVLPGSVYIKLDNGETLTIDKGKLFYKVKNFKKEDRVSVELNRINQEIQDINKIVLSK